MNTPQGDKIYWLADVRIFCQHIYGSPITPQTFSNWRKRVGIKLHSQQVSEFEAQLLVKYSELRRDHGYYFKQDGRMLKIDRSLVLKELKKSLQSDVWINAIHNNLQNVKAVPTVFRPEPTFGRDFPKLIKKVKGKSYHIRSMYRLFERIGRKFDKNRRYSSEVVQFVLDYLDRPRQRPVRQGLRGQDVA